MNKLSNCLIVLISEQLSKTLQTKTKNEYSSCSSLWLRDMVSYLDRRTKLQMLGKICRHKRWSGVDMCYAFPISLCHTLGLVFAILSRKVGQINYTSWVLGCAKNALLSSIQLIWVYWLTLKAMRH